MVAQSLQTSPTGCHNTSQQKVVRKARGVAEPARGKGRGKGRGRGSGKPATKTKLVKTTLVKAKPVARLSVKTKLVATTPSKAKHAKTKPVATTPVKTELVETAKVKAEPVGATGVKIELAAKPTQLTSKMENVYIDWKSDKRDFYSLSELVEDPYYKDGDEKLDDKPHSRKSRSYKRAFKFKTAEMLAERDGVTLGADDIVAAKQFACEQAELAAVCIEEQY